jgi:endonuclease-3
MDDKKVRARKIVAGLEKLYPDATCALQHESALQLLIATILSAQSTDETVNKVTPVLFSKYPTVEALAAADPIDVEKVIYTTGFFRQKTKSIIGAAKAIAARPGCSVPETMAELIELPGVARKTANVLLGTWFGKNVGVVVDTHVGRLAHRLGLTWSSKDEKDAVKIEQDLMEVLPQKQWTFTSHALIWHGRRVCAARKPKCGECKLSALCPSAFTFDGAVAAATTPKRQSKPSRKPRDPK